jgi:hypothetical protein
MMTQHWFQSILKVINLTLKFAFYVISALAVDYRLLRLCFFHKTSLLLPK